MHRRSNGFTLFELLLTLAIFLVVGVVVTPLYGNLSVTSQLNEETSQLVQTIRLARERSVAGLEARRHGVCFEQEAGGDRYILYQGESCALRVTSEDRVTTLSPGLDLSSSFPDQDINFLPVGAPVAVGAATLTHSVNGSRTITINELGLVEEE